MVLMRFPGDESDEIEQVLLETALSQNALAAQDPRITRLRDGVLEDAIARDLVATGAVEWAVINPRGSNPEVLYSSASLGGYSVDIDGIIKSVVDGKSNIHVTDLASTGNGVFPRIVHGGWPVSMGSDVKIAPPIKIAPPDHYSDGGAKTGDKDESKADLDKGGPIKPPTPPDVADAKGPAPVVAPAKDDCGCVRADVITALAEGKSELKEPLTEWASQDQRTKVVDAYLDEQKALNEAIVQHATPGSYLLNTLTDGAKRSDLAEQILKAERLWAASSESQLWDMVAPADRGVLAKELLRTRAGLPATPELAAHQEQFEAQRVEFEKQRVAYFGTVVEYTSEHIEQRKKWRELADVVPKILIGTLIASLLLAVVTLMAVFASKLDGWEAALILFVLAVCAISPAVLLLVERPLAGIDNFQPQGSKPDKPAADGAGSDKKDTGKKDAKEEDA